ncbi:MAG TPA: hypothetical protein VJV78_30815 [Polyangiales bacterium]|nr:hypothetical protein [Polyangiales bacterium]
MSLKRWPLVCVALCACTGRTHESSSKLLPTDPVSVAADAGTGRAGDPKQQPVDAAQAQPVDAAPVQPVDAALPVEASVPADLPLVCRFCKTPPPKGAPIFVERECTTPDAPLDAARRERFRIDEVSAAMQKPLSQALTWGTVADLGVGVRKPVSETRIEGDVTLGDFVYHACPESVSATATVRFATADGRLSATVRGDMKLSADALGWPKGGAPELHMLAFDDLSTARGTLDLGADPNKLELGEMFFSLKRSTEGDRGFVRIRLQEFPNQAAFDRANEVTDTPSSRVIHEITMGQFPLDRCNGQGRPFNGNDPSGALGGGTWHGVLLQAWTQLGPSHTVNAQWQVSRKLTSVQVDLGQFPMQVCADGWTAYFTTMGRVRSADGIGDHPVSVGYIAAKPYSMMLSSLTLQDPDLMAEVRLPAPTGAASLGSMLRDDADHIVIDTLVWPPQ